MRGVYNRASYLSRRRKLLQAWADQLEACGETAASARAPTTESAATLIGDAVERISGLAVEVETKTAKGWPQPLAPAALSARKPEPPRRIIDNWLPSGEAILLAGHGGAGKSLVALYVAVCIALGRSPWHGLAVAPRRVTYISAEDGAAVLHWRLDRTCAHLGVNLADLADRLDVLDVAIRSCPSARRIATVGAVGRGIASSACDGVTRVSGRFTQSRPPDNPLTLVCIEHAVLASVLVDGSIYAFAILVPCCAIASGINCNCRRRHEQESESLFRSLVAGGTRHICFLGCHTGNHPSGGDEWGRDYFRGVSGLYAVGVKRLGTGNHQHRVTDH